MDSVPFKIGDSVKIIKYGHLLWSYEPLSFKVYKKRRDYTIYDTIPDIVGQTGVITRILNRQYSLSGIPGKVSWYDMEQLEKV